MIRRVLCILSALALLCSLAACSTYASHYKAIMFIQEGTNTHCRLSFESLDGTYVHKLKAGKDSAGTLHVAAQLEEGSILVYCDSTGEKQLLTTVQAGEPAEWYGDEIKNGQSVWIIFETRGAARGRIQVDLENQENGGNRNVA